MKKNNKIGLTTKLEINGIFKPEDMQKVDVFTALWSKTGG
jgi:hypothetical protein